MVYLDDFEEFAQAATELYDRAPLRTRYQIKYRRCDKVLVLKGTDDVKVFKFKTTQAPDVKRVEKLTQSFMRLMSAKKHGDSSAPTPPASPDRGARRRNFGAAEGEEGEKVERDPGAVRGRC